MDESMKKKVDTLKASKLFVNNTEQGRLTEQQSILLTLTGQKPVSEVTTGIKVDTPTGWKSAPENHDKIQDLFSRLGVQCSIQDDDHASNVIISTNTTLLNQYLKSKELDEINGALFGYPKTATEAFGDNNLMMSLEEQDKIMISEGLPLFMPNFRFSKLHYTEELKVLHSWYETFKKYNLIE